jgi:integrase
MGRSGIDVREKSIRVTFTLNGKQERHTLMMNGRPMPPTPANIKYAERLAAEIKEKIRLGMFSMAEYFPASVSESTQHTLSFQLDQWLSAQRIEESTKAGYLSAIKFWKSVGCDSAGTPLGDKAIRALLTSHIQRAIATRPDLSGKTINNYVSVLREAVELAVTDNVLRENPVEKVPRAKHQKAPPDPFTREEAEIIIADMHARQPEQVANFVEFWFWAGPRTSEVFALRWPNVDFASGKVKVAEAIVRGIQKDRTKTNVERLIHLNSRSLAAITRQRKFTQMQGEAVFHDPRYDTPWIDERAFRRTYWTPTLKRLGIRYRRPYNMRHTYSTQMLMAGMNPAFCASQMGHSVEVFHKTYAKWLHGAQNELEMQRLEAALSGNLSQSYPWARASE